MKLIASIIVRNELGRYLELCVAALLEFCDEVRVLDDYSSDGTYEWLISGTQVARGVSAIANFGEKFYEHEGRARGRLLDFTLSGNPTHVLSIDADEFVGDGRAIRAAIDMDDEQPVWTLAMSEVWKADARSLWLRRDGGWRVHNAPVLWRVPKRLDTTWRIKDVALACGREPMAVRAQFRHALKTGTEILHFGWANVDERQARYERYVEHDDGQFHNKRHLDSIMYPDRRVALTRHDWPRDLIGRRDAILECVERA